MIELATVFLAGYSSVLLLGFNSRNVNSGNYSLAALTSFAIGIAQAFLWKTITDIDGFWAIGVYSLSGALGITSAMYLHERFVKRDNTSIRRDTRQTPVLPMP